MGYFTCAMSSETGNLCNKCPQWLVEQNSSYSDYLNAISGFTSNSRAPGGPVTVRGLHGVEYGDLGGVWGVGSVHCNALKKFIHFIFL